MTVTTTTPAEITAYIAAQRELAARAEDYVLAFSTSAIACSVAMGVKGVTLQKLADANKLATADLAPFAPKGTLYTSVEAVSYHSLTGDLLRLAFDEEYDAEDPKFDGNIAPFDVQTLIIKVKRVKWLGVPMIREIVANAESQQQAVEMLKEALTVKDPSIVDTTNDVTGAGAGDGEDGEDGETFGEGATTVLPDQTVETLLARALSMIVDGAELTDAARSLVADLVAKTGPVAVPDLAVEAA